MSYTSLTKNPKKATAVPCPDGILLSSTNLKHCSHNRLDYNWLKSLHLQTGFNNNRAVFWGKQIAGIRNTSNSITVPQIGTKIAIKGTAYSEMAYPECIYETFLFGEIEDVILPETTISDLCANFEPDELGFSDTYFFEQHLFDIVRPASAAYAGAFISQILYGSINMNFSCVGYVIDTKALLPLDSLFYSNQETSIYFSFINQPNCNMNEWKIFVDKVLKTRPNCKGVYVK